ncbi:hypothetical protein Esi_0049_0027 [Ectocarpus siliculosus]|uniref:Uncharacterized protein n=1 Tax=Ectocarpus siliculosus TaxID=2880 RepID=D7G2W5_ECTSI|nr:hypothetical protein Esi_0049_0027 [Ectocarpus siliculosus]|eukprot:CBJ48822.1 hypothetical protein Esi_0049_0027 [Ectocarpus siliculosus]
MEATAVEQQREARRQKVLARSQGGHRAPVVDLATEQKEIAPRGVTADLDDDVGAVLDDHPLPAPEDEGKSASRLAAERRRQRILSRSTERMAKVQGDRVIRSGDAAQGEESLDDMLEAAEVEFFGGKEKGTTGVAEVKPAAARQQAYFKSGGGGGGPSRDEGGGGVGAAAAQRKPSSRQRLGDAEGAGLKHAARSDGGASRQSPPSGGGGGRASSRRPTGNKALEKQGFDLAAIQSLSRAAGTDNSGVGGAATPGRKRLLGGVRFWTGLEGVTKTALLLLLGAGVGGLLLPEARAAVAQAKFEAEHMQGFADSRSRLELFLAGDGGSEGRNALDEGFDAGSTAADEFGDVGDAYSSSSGSFESAENTEDSEEDAKVDGVAEGRGDEAVLAATMGEEEGGDVGHDGMLSEATDWFLNFVDMVVGWAHYLSAVSMPWGGGVGEISCVSAIYLAIFVRLVVAVAFSGVRVMLGLPAFPAANPTSKPGMVMGMVLATVPTLGKVLAWGNVVKSIFSDTNLVVAGTVLTLALNLAFEEGAGPRRLAGSISGALGLFSPSFQGSEEGDYSGGGGDLKEL